MFRKYDHVERLGHDDVSGLIAGDVYVFPKLDGTNSSIWFEEVEYDYKLTPRPTVHITRCGSRTRELSVESDNAGFCKWVASAEVQWKLCELYQSGAQDWTIYGEWLVPHTLKTYREDSWRKFYVFDVYDNNKEKYLHYEQYEPTIKAAGLDVIEPMCVYTNPSEEQLQREASNNTYLILDGAGCGEGIVIKNYNWTNTWGKQPWAKIVRNEFKEENQRAFGTAVKGGEYQVEAAIAETYVTQALVEKVRSKIRIELLNQDTESGVQTWEAEADDSDFSLMYRKVEERHRGQMIPRLLGTVYHDVVSEELWGAVKEHKDPTIDFKKLKAHCILWTKKYAADLF